MRMLHAVIGVAVASGCGGGGGVAIDAAIADDARAIDAPVDADDPPVDASMATAALVANDGTATITQWMAPATYAGTATHLRLFVYNSGAVPTGALTATLMGADAASFSITSANSTCGPSLAAGDACYVDLAFAPSAVGSRSAMLVVAGTGATLSLPISGVAPLMPSGVLVADVAFVDFGTVVSGDNPVSAQVIISNAGTSAFTLGARTTTGAFTYASDNCPATLTPGGACTANLLFQNSPLGSSTGTFDVASSGGALSLPLHGVTLRKLHVTSTGLGAFGVGSVATMPSGVPCGPGNSNCTAGFPLGVSVVLTATPAANNMFVKWDGLCSGATAMCTVATPLQGTVYVQFVPTNAKKITVTFAGTGRSLVNAHMTNSQFGSYGSCTSDCVVYVPQNAQVEVVGGSPSTFVGWTGDCTTTTHICALGTIANDRAVTITSNLDQYEVTSMFPPIDVMRGLAVLPNSDLVFGTPTGVTVVNLAGAIVRTTPIEGGARSIVVDAAGHVYGIGTAGVFALSATGTPLWTRSFPVAARNSFSFASTVSVSPDGTVIGVLTDDGVHVVDGSGVDRFTITGVTPAPQAVAVSPAGTVGIAIRYDVPAGSGNRQVLRYSSAGTPLSALVPIPGGNQISIMYDANENLAAATATSTRFTTSATSPANTTSFSAADVTNLGSPPGSGVAVTASGKVAGFRMYNLANGNATGTALRAFSPTGSVLINHDHPPDLTVPYSFDNMLVPSQITAGGGTNRIVTAGSYNNIVWISVIDLP